jgi:L-ascorbate metabolism protein UlaG (beta-lactamase superfamily)
MEITSFGGTCLRFKGREGVVVADGYSALVGPTGRGLTADVATYSHVEDQAALRLDGDGPQPLRRGEGIKIPTSLTNAFLLDSPGEYEVHEILVTGVRTYRDEQKGLLHGRNTAFVYELDGLHAVHLGEIGHLLTEDMIDKLGPVAVLCVPVGGSLGAAKAAELVTQLDAKLIVPMPLETEGVAGEMEKFLHEMSVQQPEAATKLSVTISSLPTETTVALLEARGRT